MDGKKMTAFNQQAEENARIEAEIQAQADEYERAEKQAKEDERRRELSDAAAGLDLTQKTRPLSERAAEWASGLFDEGPLDLRTPKGGHTRIKSPEELDRTLEKLQAYEGEANTLAGMSPDFKRQLRNMSGEDIDAYVGKSASTIQDEEMRAKWVERNGPALRRLKEAQALQDEYISHTNFNIKNKPPERATVNPESLARGERTRDSGQMQPTKANANMKAPLPTGSGNAKRLRDVGEQYQDSMGQVEIDKAEAYGRQEIALSRVADAEERLGEVRSRSYREQAAAMERFNMAETAKAKELQERQAAYDEAYKGKEKELDQMRADVRNLQVDTGNFYKNADGSTNYGRTIGAALAIAFGQLGAGLTGQRNTALDIINRAVDQDIEEQKGYISNARVDLAEKKNELAEMTKKFGDEKTAQAAMRISRLEDFNRQIDALAMNSKSEQAIQAAVKSKAEIDGQIGAIRHSLADEQGKMAAQGATMRAGLIQQEGQAQQMAAVSWAEQMKAMAEAQKASGASVEPSSKDRLASMGLETLHGGAPSKEELSTAQDVLVTSRTMRSGVERIKSLRSGATGVTIDPDKAAEINQVATDIRMMYKELRKLGALSESDYDALDAVIPSKPTGTDWIDGTKLDSLLGIVNRGTAVKLGAYGFRELGVGPPR